MNHEALKRSLTPGPHGPLPAPLGGKDSSQKPAQGLSGGNPSWRGSTPPTFSQEKQAEALIRPNVQEVVGTAWAQYMLQGEGAGVVDAISEAISAKLAANPEFFYGGR